MTAEDTRSRYFEDLYRLLCDRERSLEEKVDRTIEIGRERLGVDHGLVTYTGDGNYEVLDSDIESGEYAPGSVTDLGTTWCRHVVEDREPLSFGDVEETPYRDDVAKEATGLHCYIGYPLVVDGVTYGTLCFSSEAPRADFTEDEEHFVSLLASWISHELEREKHHRELRTQNERLDDFTGIVAHDLRNPLAGATGYLEIALEDASGEQAEYLRVVEQSLERMDDLIGELLLLARQGMDVGERTPVSIEAVASEAWRSLRTAEASLAIESEKTIYADETRLRQLFENLFRNAIEHCQPDVSIVVSDVEGGFAVEDDGPGLPEGIAESLFDPTARGGELPGFGLLIVERVVSGHDWRGAVETDPSGTRFEFARVESRS